MLTNLPLERITYILKGKQQIFGKNMETLYNFSEGFGLDSRSVRWLRQVVGAVP